MARGAEEMATDLETRAELEWDTTSGTAAAFATAAALYRCAGLLEKILHHLEHDEKKANRGRGHG